MQTCPALDEWYYRAEIEKMYWEEYNGAKRYEELYNYWLRCFRRDVDNPDAIIPWNGAMVTPTSQLEQEYWDNVYTVWKTERLLAVEPPA